MSGRNGAIIFMLMGVGIALLAVSQVRAVLQQSQQTEVQETQPIVVAAVDIPTGTLLTTEHLAVRELPLSFIDGGMFLDVQELIGRQATTAMPIPAGGIILRNQMANLFGLEPGYRAVSVNVNSEQSVGQNILPGNQIDVMVNYSYANEELLDTLAAIRGGVVGSSDVYNQLFQEEVIKQLDAIQQDIQTTEHATQLVLQNVQVLAVNSVLPSIDGQSINSLVELSNDAILEDQASPTSLVVTLALLPDDAQKLLHAKQYGDSIHLMLRRQDDDVIPVIPPLTGYLNPAEQ